MGWLDTAIGLGMAYVLALPLGWEREQGDRSAGLRTFPLVAIAACGYVLLARSVFAGVPEAQARILEGTITGIGFLGGGAILKGDDRVRGTATAASIWVTAGIGTAVGYDQYDVAVGLSLLSLVALRVLVRFKAPGSDLRE